MTPRLARVALGGFVLLAAGVTGNALYLQGGPDRFGTKAAAPPRSEPQRQPGALPGTQKSSSSKAGKPADRAATETPPETRKAAQSVKVRMVRVATIGEATAEEADADTVRAVLTELNRRGYGPLAIDGAMSPAARAAVMAFEQEHRLPLTGEANQERLKQLIFGAPAPSGAGALEVRSPHAQALIKDVQRLLDARGYRVGAVDGRLSAETIAAIRTFETDQGLAPKGRISVAVLERLQSGIAGGGRHTAN
jgi:peptidoglycan hydrolase-like protein with peptidoglycan-binding domain